MDGHRYLSTEKGYYFIDDPRQFRNPPDDVIRDLLTSARRIAVVGLSPNPERPSHAVARYLKRRGFEIVPVNPNCANVFDLVCYPSLYDVPGTIDVVDVFRRSDAVGTIAEAAVAVGARVLWLQEGVINLPAARLATTAGLVVVMDRCMAVEHARLLPRQTLRP